MALTGKALWQSDSSSQHTPEILRQLASDMLGGFVTGGVADRAALKVTANGTLGASVAAGKALVPGTLSTTQGTYACYHTVADSIANGSADPTNPRIDSVVLKVQDSVYSGGSDQWAVSVVAGTPAASPVAPALPASCIELAQITVPNATNLAAQGGVIVAANIADRRVWYPPYVKSLSTDFPALSYDGQQRYDTDTDVLYVSKNGHWAPLQPAYTTVYNNISWAASAIDADLATWSIGPFAYDSLVENRLSLYVGPSDSVDWDCQVAVFTAASAGGTLLGNAGFRNVDYGTVDINTRRSLFIQCDEDSLPAGTTRTYYLHIHYATSTPTVGLSPNSINQNRVRTRIHPA